jgi:hypothetical protein
MTACVTVTLTVDHGGRIALEELAEEVATCLERTELYLQPNDSHRVDRATILEANAVGEAVAI